MTLKPCPCGKVPTYLSIDDQHEDIKYARAYCPECFVWSVAFRHGYLRLDDPHVEPLAVAAWNRAPRKEDA